MSGPTSTSIRSYTPPSRGSFRPQLMASNGMVTAGHYLAAWWGAQVLERGGNAADAGVAAGLVINVVHNDMAGIGGVAPIVYRDAAKGSVSSISGVGRWPAATNFDALYAQYGEELPTGLPRTVTPAAADAWVTALQRFGSMPWSEVAAYPIRLATEGFPVHHFLAANLAKNAGAYRRWPENERIYMPGGRIPKPGEILVQPELGRLFRHMVEAEHGAAGDRAAGLDAVRDAFYGGQVAADTVNHYQGMGSAISAEDLASFRVGDEPPIQFEYEGRQLWGTGPWSQGPVLPMALNVLKSFDLRRYEPGDPALLHLVAESIKLAFADLEAHCGDPEFVDVPMEALLHADYGAMRASLIDPGRAIEGVAPFGDPLRGIPNAGSLRERPAPSGAADTEPDTSFVCAVDRQGNLFSATPSDGHSGNPVVPGWGFSVSSRGRQSRLEPGHPNRLAAGKRPRLTPNPFLVTLGDEPYMTLGTPGNNRQPQAMLQVFLNTEVFGMMPQEAVERPRIASYSFPETAYPHRARPGVLRLERAAAAAEAELTRLGHVVEVVPDFSWSLGGVCIIKRDPGTGVLWGGADPRRETYTVGL